MKSKTMGKWIDLRDKDKNIIWENLPEIDQFCLFLHENGFSWCGHIDKDMDEEYIEHMLDGNDLTGPVVAWMELPPYTSLYEWAK